MKKSKNIFWGVAIILVAVLIILSNVPSITVFNIFSLWDIILLVILTAFLIKGIVSVDFFEMFLPIGIAYYIVTKDLDAASALPAYLPKFELWCVLIVAVLLSIGFSILFKKHKKIKITTSNNNKVIDNNISGHQSSEDGVISIESTMGNMTRYIDSNDFRELNADNNFGQLNIYLSNCTLASAQCKVNLDNNFGTINLYVPKEWQVELNPESSFGKVEFHKNSEAPAGAPIAYINADSSFGTIEIHQV